MKDFLLNVLNLILCNEYMGCVNLNIPERVGLVFDAYKIASMDTLNYNECFREICKENKCRNYGKVWTCPPAVKSIPEIKSELKKYENFLIFYQVYQLRKEIDFRYMLRGYSDFQYKVSHFKKELIESGYDFIITGAGGCRLCERCTYLDNEPCRRPNESVIATEAFGINLSKLMKDNNLPYDAGPRTVTFIGTLFYN